MDRLGPFLLLATAAIYLFMCPYTKVEESFNIQAIHDLCYHRTDIDRYDHLKFPGVVPRTFLGALAVSTVYCPLASVLQIENGIYRQMLARAVLGFMVFSGFYRFAIATRRFFGQTLFRFFCLISASQFHFCFYMTRTLPNTFALVLVLHMLPTWMRLMWAQESTSSGIRSLRSFAALAACSILVFRFELTLLCGCLYLTFLYSRMCKLREEAVGTAEMVGTLGQILLKTISAATSSGLLAIGLSMLVDSFFWQTLLWPEGAVAWFNIVLNKSSQWGTHHFLWYFASALPRMLLTSAVFVPLGLITDGRMRQMGCAAVGFILLYSFLPHKELRFVLYCLPMLNVVAAAGYQWTIRLRSPRLRSVAVLCCVASLLMSSLQCAFFVIASKDNYPGGVALTDLQSRFAARTGARVFIDNMAAQTGVTRFLEDNTIPAGWIYDKTENKTDFDLFNRNFDFLLLDANRLDRPGSRNLWQRGYVVNETYGSFAGFNKRFLLNLSSGVIIQSPALSVLMRTSVI